MRLSAESRYARLEMKIGCASPTGENHDDFQRRRRGIFLKFGGASVLASRLVSSLAPPNVPPRWGWRWIWV